MKPFQDKVAIVTGGGRGIGAATALLLAHKGATVVVASKTMSELEEVVRQCPDRIFPFQTDVSISSDLDNLFNFIQTRWGSLNILINGAAVLHLGSFESLSVEAWKQSLDINIMGSVLCSWHAFRLMKKQGGNIINISSLGGIQNTQKFPGMSAYITSKFAITGFTEALAVEGRDYKIRVNALAPGAVNTRMLQEALPHLQTSTQPEDIANMICYVVDDSQCKMSGSVIPIFSNE